MEPIIKDNKIMAYSYPIKVGKIVYGTKYLKRSDLRDLFPQYQFCFVKQVHGRTVVPANSGKLVEADAHWTEEKNRALVVHTADCLPVLLNSGRRICAVHAGWRGVENQIVLSALKIFPDLSELEVGIGPHITQESFIVSKDVADKLKKSSPQGENRMTPIEEEKYRVSLMDLMKDQILHKTSVKGWWNLPINTFSSNLFHSFRRTAEKNIGQSSFIVLD
ncbi:MAG: polyphenol oxidase family protein [Bdellovibrionales bacterium]|nr:polyphenol oxidase family protein [Bdellovibrionales bacterium]